MIALKRVCSDGCIAAQWREEEIKKEQEIQVRKLLGLTQASLVIKNGRLRWFGDECNNDAQRV